MTKNNVQSLLLMLAIFLGLCNLTQSFGFYSSSTENQAKPFSGKENKLDVDLITRLKVIHPEQDYIDSIQRLDSLRFSEPDCFEIATVLIGSCESVGVKSSKFNSAPKDVAADLEILKNLYAARLAVCELRGVGASVPPQCSIIFHDREIMTRENLKVKWSQPRPKSDEENKIEFSKVRPCFKALEARQQSWTSFSNNKQNAELWCRLGKDAIEKNEVLEISKTAVHIMGEASSKLSEVVQHSAKSLVDLNGFAGATDVHLSQLLANLETSNDTLNSLVETFVQKLQFALSEALSSVHRVNSDASDLYKNITDSGFVIRNSLQKVSQDVIGGLAEAAASQQHILMNNNELVIQVKQDLQSIHVDSVRVIMTALKEFYLQAHSFQEALVSIRTTQNDISQHALKAALSLKDTVSSFEELRISHVGYAVNQSLFIQEMQYQQQVVLAFQRESNILAANNLADAAAVSKLLREAGWFLRALARFAIPLLWLCWIVCCVLLWVFRCIDRSTAVAFISIAMVSKFIADIALSGLIPSLISRSGTLLGFQEYDFWNPPRILSLLVLSIGVGAMAVWRFRLLPWSYRIQRPPCHHYDDVLSFQYDGQADENQLPVTDFACFARPATLSQYPPQYRINLRQ